ncbi:hypothetical protein Tco_0567020 [Tanacetum coccineum]
MSSSSSSSSHATVKYTFSEPEAPLSPVHALEDLEYLASSDDDIAPVEDQPLPASPIALSLGYIVDSEPIKDEFEEDPEMDPVDYADEEEEEEEPSEDEEEEEHLALADFTLSVPDSAPSAKKTEPFETDESTATPPPPRSPHTVIPLSQTGLRRAWKTVRPQPPMAASTKVLIAEYASAPTPPLPLPSPLSPLSSPLPLISSPPLLLSSPTCMDIIPEANMPLQKRVRFTAPSHRFEIGESSAAATARQTGPTLTRGVDYGFIDTLDASIQATDKRVMTALEEVNQRMTDLAATYRHDIEEFYTQARYARQAWAHSKGRSQAMKAQIKALQAETRVLQR